MATTKKTTTAKNATAKKVTTRKSPAKRVKKVEEPQHIGLVRNDSWLEPFEAAIRGRHDHAQWKIAQLTRNGKQTLSQFASGHLYFGLHKLDYTNSQRGGCSASGLPMQRKSTSLVTSTIGRNPRNISVSALKARAIGN